MKVNDDLIIKRVVDSASDFLHRKGLKGWNMDNLASAAGITKPTLYKIVSSKEELIKNVVINDIRSMFSKALKVRNSKSDYIIAFEKFFIEYSKFFTKGNLDYMQRALLEYPALEKNVLKYSDELSEQIIDFIKEGILIKKIRKDVNPEHAFELLRAIVHHNVITEGKPSERARKIRAMFNLLIYGIRDK